MRLPSKVGATTFAVAIMSIAAASPAAFAQSTTMYPAGDSVSLSSTPETIVIPTFQHGSHFYGGTTTCTFSGGAFTVPSTGNSSGPVTIKFTTRPAFTGCTEITNIGTKTKVPVAIVTEGEWTFSAQYGTAAVALATSGSGGITIDVAGEPAMARGGSLFAGGWDNGFASPVSVSSAMQYGATLTMGLIEQGEKKVEITFPQTLLTMTDTTHPASLPVLGP